MWLPFYRYDLTSTCFCQFSKIHVKLESSAFDDTIMCEDVSVMYAFTPPISWFSCLGHMCEFVVAAVEIAILLCYFQDIFNCVSEL